MNLQIQRKGVKKYFLFETKTTNCANLCEVDLDYDYGTKGSFFSSFLMAVPLNTFK